MSEVPGAPDGGPYPDPRSAFLLTVATFVASGFIGIFFLGLGAVAAIGIGQAVAVGTIATISAKRIPEPQAERIGLRSFDPRALPMVLCLVPAILLGSELDNYATDWSPVDVEAGLEAEEDAGSSVDSVGGPFEETADDASAEASDMPFPGVGEGFASENGATEVELSPEEVALEELRVDLDDPWTLAQAFVISVGITPVVEEFFFRGVLQQSLVARLGLARGIGFVALLYTLPHLPAVATLPRFLAGIVSAFGIGCLLGLVRVATGSILASIILASLTAGVGILSFAVRENLPLPGMNVEGTHLPITVTIASIVVVAWAAHAVYEEATKKFEAELLREK
jgi:membrane protease YdiL (CAAX protease family)